MEEQKFNYTYSAKEQEEIKKIRERYQPKAEKETGLEKIRSLDAKVTQKATKVSIVLGILGALILGIGMSLVMTDIGAVFGIQTEPAIMLGILIGLPGMTMVGCAYPVYLKCVKAERERMAPQILKLADELMVK